MGVGKLGKVLYGVRTCCNGYHTFGHCNHLAQSGVRPNLATKNCTYAPLIGPCNTGAPIGILGPPMQLDRPGTQAIGAPANQSRGPNPLALCQRIYMSQVCVVVTCLTGSVSISAPPDHIPQSACIPNLQVIPYHVHYLCSSFQPSFLVTNSTVYIS